MNSRQRVTAGRQADLILASLLGTAGPRQERRCVTCPDGTRLDVTLYRSRSGNGPYPVGSQPVVVLPASWAATQSSFAAMLTWLADSGYLAVGYTPRGFGGSGGLVDAGSPQDVADFRTVLDWTLANFPSADRRRIAALGVSYGAAISLLSAAADDRVTTVVALDGWADLYAALADDDTPRLNAAVLLSSGLLRGRAEHSFVAAMARFYTGLQLAELKHWAARRSVASCVEQLNARSVSVLLSAGWNDTVLRPDPTIDLHAALTTRSVLLLHPDDHPIVPVAQLASHAGREVWQYARRWLDHEMRRLPTVVDRSGAVVVLGSTAPHSVENVVPPTANPGVPYGLGPPRILGPGLLAGRGGAWSNRLLGAIPSGATDRIVLLTSLVERATGLAPGIWFPMVPGSVAASWLTAPGTSTGHLRGFPRLRLAVTCPARRVTLTAHLYDVGPSGFGQLISQGAATLTTGGRCPVPVDLRLRATFRDIPTGHRIGLLVGTSDPTCAIRTRFLSRVTLHSHDDSPATLSLPFVQPTTAA
ncbi:CocE/NonD family hydrolase [Streptomyces sp. NPDC058812]|uniref:CocE/NonD family hydrolase n=1 Tax=unclassified Streptomyces TaxID=2593676 RepID=UPI00369CB527